MYGWRRWQPNPPGHRRNLRELSKDAQDVINQSGEARCATTQEYKPKLTEQRKNKTTDRNTKLPPSHSPTEASGWASIFETKIDGFLLSEYLVFITTCCNTNTQRSNNCWSVFYLSPSNLTFNASSR